MSFDKYGKGYFDHRTLYQIDRLYAWKNGLYFPPVVVEINPTSFCNQKCRYCYVAGRTSGKLEGNMLLRLLPQLANTGIKAIVFQGAGEPLLHDALPDSIEIGAEYNLSMTITTNGVLLNQKMQEKILKNLSYIKFSAIESNPQRYAYTHGCSEKQWEMLIENIKNAIIIREQNKLQILYIATIYLTKDNFHDAYNIVKYFKEIGLDYISVQEAVYNKFSYTGSEELASSFFTANEINEMKSKISSLKDDGFFIKVRFPLNDINFINGRYQDCWVNNWCNGIKFNTLINSDGEVYPCFRYWGMKDFSYGNIYEKSFEEIWKGEKRREVEKFTNNTPPNDDECSTCNVTKINAILYDLQNLSSNKWKDFLI